MGEPHLIGQLDLLAFADDPLGLEPQRRAAVEAHLRGHPGDAARVEAFRRQNAALRERYGPFIHAPVPQRLYDVLERRAGRSRFSPLRHAAAAAIVLATASAGWIAGERFGGPAPLSVDEQPLTAEDLVATDGGDAAEPLTAEPVSVAGILEFGASLPDLGHLGYSLVSTEPVPGSSSEAVRLSFAGADGRSFTLLLRSRWHDPNPGFRVHREGDASVVSWKEGRLAAEITSRAGREEALEIAEAVRNALRSSGPAGPLPEDGRLAAGAADPLGPIEADSPLLPQQVQ